MTTQVCDVCKKPCGPDCIRTDGGCFCSHKCERESRTSIVTASVNEISNVPITLEHQGE